MKQLIAMSKYIGVALMSGAVGATATWLMTHGQTPQTSNTTAPSRLPFLSWGGKSSWGNYPKISAQEHTFETITELRHLLQQTSDIIPRGNGRSYGDSALAPHLISCMRYNKFISFDEKEGLVRCQSGVLLSEILDVVVPHGWFLAVTPGTKLISVGGAIASDVHGKSQHHAGNFSDHLVSLTLMLADGTVHSCSPTENSELYWTTCGGMGLTGVILEATIRLIPVETAYFRQESIRADNLDELMDLFEESAAWPYSVAWIDCLTSGKGLGRGFIIRGNHATLDDLAGDARRHHPLQPKSKLELAVPFLFPDFVLNSLTARIFNAVLYHKHIKRRIKSVVDYNSFFYPLDVIYKWNRIYGPSGFTQYQLILPKDKSREGIRIILEKISEKGMGSFLAVLKLYGKQHGYLPFAMEGYSLALDFPIRPELFPFLDELDEIVMSYGGRLYLTKDVRMSEAMFKQTYPQTEQFLQNLKQFDPEGKFRSLQSDRVGLTSSSNSNISIG